MANSAEMCTAKFRDKLWFFPHISSAELKSQYITNRRTERWLLVCCRLQSLLPVLAPLSGDILDGDIWQCTQRTVNHSRTVTVRSKHRPRPIKKGL